MILPSDRIKEMLSGGTPSSLLYKGVPIICPIHGCSIELYQPLRFTWCPECIKACDEKERHYFDTIMNPRSTGLDVEVAISKRQYESKQRCEKMVDKPFGTTLSIRKEQREMDEIFAERAKSGEGSLSGKYLRKANERMNDIINNEIESRVKTIAISMTSESVVEALDTSLRACVEQTETIITQRTALEALWKFAKHHASCYSRLGDAPLPLLKAVNAKTIEDFITTMAEVSDDEK